MVNPEYETPFSMPPLPLRRAAVLIALLYDNVDSNIDAAEHCEILLTVRHPDLPKHPGQVALPGGTRDPEDYSLLDTALRESLEETGLKPDWLTHHCQLPDFVASSGFRITPFVALAPKVTLNNLTANPDEVSELFTLPLSQCLDPQAYQLTHIEHKGVPRAFYDITGTKHRVWGVTAGILWGFREWLGQALY